MPILPVMSSQLICFRHSFVDSMPSPRALDWCLPEKNTCPYNQQLFMYLFYTYIITLKFIL